MSWKDNVIERYWHCHVTTPSPEGKNRYNVNKTFGVVAKTADDVIVKIRQVYPDATIWSVQHRGSVDLGIVEHDLGYHESDLNK